MASANKQATAVVHAGGSISQEVWVANQEFLTVIGDIGPTATAAGDVSVKVIPYLSFSAVPDEGTEGTVADAGLALVQDTNDPGVAAYLAGGHARVMVRVRVQGLEKVSIVLFNNNATTDLPGRVDWFVS